MGIRVFCPNGHKLNVKSFLAGKKGICPHCGARFEIPAAPDASGSQPAPEPEPELAHGAALYEPELDFASMTSQPGHSPAAEAALPEFSVALAQTPVVQPEHLEVVSQPAAPIRQSQAAVVDPITAAPDANWYLRPASGGQFGPAQADVMRQWLGEGRVGTDSLVWREGWTDWQKADVVFPQLAPVVTPAATAAPAAASNSGFDLGSVASSPIERPVARRSRKKGPSQTMIVSIALGVLIIVLGVILVIYLTYNNKKSKPESSNRPAATTSVSG